jgi:hypothetical protein
MSSDKFSTLHAIEPSPRLRKVRRSLFQVPPIVAHGLVIDAGQLCDLSITGVGPFAHDLDYEALILVRCQVPAVGIMASR